MHPANLHSVGVISKLYFAIFAAFKELMTLNLAQRSFKVTHFGGNRKSVYYFIQAVYSNFSSIFNHLGYTDGFIRPANCVSKQVSARAHEYVGLIGVMHPATLHGVGVITKLYFAIFAAFKESMTLNLVQRSFKVITFGTNQQRVYIFLLVVNSNLDSILHRFRDTAA